MEYVRLIVQFNQRGKVSTSRKHLGRVILLNGENFQSVREDSYMCISKTKRNEQHLILPLFYYTIDSGSVHRKISIQSKSSVKDVETGQRGDNRTVETIESSFVDGVDWELGIGYIQ